MIGRSPLPPPSLIAKLPTVDTELHERATVFQPGLRENWFYRRGASRSPVHVPRCYHRAIDSSTGQSILLLEDLAPAPPGNQLEGATLHQAELALEALARLHASWWADTASPELQELTHLLSDTGAGEQNLVQELYDTAWPQFLRQGVVDVSWFLGGCLPVERSHHETDLLRHYHQTLIDEGVEDYSWTQCYYDYRYAMCSSFVQSVLSATPGTGGTEHERKLARVVGQRFTAAAQRLRLLELVGETQGRQFWAHPCVRPKPGQTHRSAPTATGFAFGECAHFTTRRFLAGKYTVARRQADGRDRLG